MFCEAAAHGKKVKEVTDPGAMAFGLFAVYGVNCKLGAALCNAAVSQPVIVAIPAPVRVMPLITVADPGLLREIVMLEVAVVAGSALTPP